VNESALGITAYQEMRREEKASLKVEKDAVRIFCLAGPRLQYDLRL